METKEIETISTILLVPLFLCGLIFSSPSFAVATLLGGALMIANFTLLNRGMRSVLLGKQKKKRFFIQYTLRFTLLATAIYLALSWDKINIAGFVAGLSVVFLGIVVGAARNSFLIKKPPETNRNKQIKSGETGI